MKIQLYTDQQFSVLKINGVEYRAQWANEKIALERTAELAQQFLDTHGGPVGVTTVPE